MPRVEAEKRLLQQQGEKNNSMRNQAEIPATKPRALWWPANFFKHLTFYGAGAGAGAASAGASPKEGTGTYAEASPKEEKGTSAEASPKKETGSGDPLSWEGSGSDGDVWFSSPLDDEMEDRRAWLKHLSRINMLVR